MSGNSFFDEQKEQSLVKTRIVEKYFWAWTRIMIPQVKESAAERGNKPKIAYIDLFAGTGCYKDGAESTPIKILRKAISDPELRNMLVTAFNEGHSGNFELLKENISSIPGINTLEYQPQIFNNEVDERFAKLFENLRLVPTLFFVDPCGYKGLSLNLINALTKHWGCDCIFFFNYNRIRAALNNPVVKKHMNALFGKERAEQMCIELEPLHQSEREEKIMKEMSNAIAENRKNKYVSRFCFKSENANRTSHYLMFVSKSKNAHKIMRDIMAVESSGQEQGVSSFEYNPNTSTATAIQLSLFDINRPLDQLEAMLEKEFAGKTLRMIDIYNEHHVDQHYTIANYKAALKNLESKGKIIVEPTIDKRRPNTFGDSVRVTFPLKR